MVRTVFLIAIFPTCLLSTATGLQHHQPPSQAGDVEELPSVNFLTKQDLELARWHWGRRSTAVGSYPYADLIPEATEYCYEQLVNDSGCCLDSVLAEGVEMNDVTRKGTGWTCNGADCFVRTRGPRGMDTVWVPPEATCSSPRILYIHGGSWTSGSPQNMGYPELCSKLAALTGAMIMAVDYPLLSGTLQAGPSGAAQLQSEGDQVGVRFDQILSASEEALRWLAENGPRKDCDPATRAPVFVGGDSAGGGTALSLMIKVNVHPELLPGRKIAGGFLFSPWTNLKCNTPEYYFNAYAKIVEDVSFQEKKKPNMAFVGDIVFRGRPGENKRDFMSTAVSYVGFNRSLLDDPIASPYYATSEHLRGLPPLYVAVGGSESILGDSVVVAQKAAASNVDVHLDIYPGMWHVFPMYSEGCGSGRPLWHAMRALNTTALFVRHLGVHGRPPFRAVDEGPVGARGASTRRPFTSINYHPRVPGPDVDMAGMLAAVKERSRQEVQG